MANTIHVDIVSAEDEIYAGEAKMEFAPASGGEIGIAPRHVPLLTTMKGGEVRVQDLNGEEHLFWVGGGALEVQPHKVTVLADTAARAKDWTKRKRSCAQLRRLGNFEKALKPKPSRGFDSVTTSYASQVATD
jgi:F-type H+-transporting ATPase subunit epsilon